ncbi:galactokinase [Persicobacter psychrovividus]|uniref:Galactokinase n=1 Tax=Persicobacter psychrovividus TaxID=387638 RepID=A0ABM7VGX7_9BACT|nr:galactokinase [Persicobacter psychrovividus]
MDTLKLVEKFESQWDENHITSRAPGRMNIIGEHTDYNGGFVLPAAIDKEIVCILQANNTNTINAIASDLDEKESFTLEQITATNGWINYIKGVVAELIKKGVKVQGFNLVFGGDVPLGAGLSSSAALECALATGLNNLFGGKLSQREIALVGQAAEHNYAGVKCGIMDQFASTFGQKDHVIKIDCKHQETAHFPLNTQGFKWVLCNTGVSHSLASSEYNTRREQCEAGVAVLQKEMPKLEDLRGATLAQLKAHRSAMDPTIYKRCEFVINENERVLKACKHLENNELDALGALIYASHDGLQHDYEVSCKELDFLVDQTRDNDQVFGARMMGGGFGGCTINLVRTNAVDSFIEMQTEAYQKQFNRKLVCYTVVTGDGARVED